MGRFQPVATGKNRPKADMLMSTTPSTLALIIPASFWLEASLLSIHDSPPTSLTLWQSDGPSF